MNRSHVYLCTVLLLAGVVFFLNLGKPRLWDRDEPRNAGCAREMLERQDWVVPVFNGELRDHKPVLLYWFMMLAYRIFGANEFAARFFSAVFGLGTVALTYDLGRRAFRPQIGFWAALMLSTCMMFPVAARAATPDSLLIFFTVAALWLYARGIIFEPIERQTRSARSWWLVGSYAAMGCAVLAKGPVGFVLPVAIIGLFHLLDEFSSGYPDGRGLRQWLRFAGRLCQPARMVRVAKRMWLLGGIVVMLLVAGPWYVWVGIRTDGAWLRGFFLTHNVGRFLHPMEDHSGPIFYYLLALFGCFFPWALFIVPAVKESIRGMRSDKIVARPLLFFLIWAFGYLGFFSLAGTKLPNYITPALPAVALITSWWLDNWLRDSGEKLLAAKLASWLIVGVGFILTVAVIVAARIFVPGEERLGLLGIVLISGGVVSLVAIHRGRRRAFAVALATAAWVFAVGIFGVAAVRISRHQQFVHLVRILQELQSASKTPVEVAAYDSLEPSWVFYLGRPIRFIAANEDMAVLESLANKKNVCLLVTTRCYEKISDKLSTHLVSVAAVPYFLKKKTEILLLASPELVASLSPSELRSGVQNPPRTAQSSDSPYRR